MSDKSDNKVFWNRYAKLYDFEIKNLYSIMAFKGGRQLIEYRF